jgi:hypothetical protein
MPSKKYKTANLTEDQAARKWADYMRLRRRPEKVCWTCHQIFPNTLEYFVSGVRGRVGVRCHSCVAANPVPTRVKQPCPCCNEFTRLVRDRHAPSQQAIFLCTTCLRTVNAVLAASAATRKRLEKYVEWREKATAQSEAAVVSLEASTHAL